MNNELISNKQCVDKLRETNAPKEFMEMGILEELPMTPHQSIVAVD